MATAIEQILVLKKRKEDHAQTAARAARLALEQAAHKVERCRTDAEAFARQLSARQASLYDELEARVCVPSDIEAVREEIARMRQREAALHAEVQAAEQARRTAAEAAEAARQSHFSAVKKVEKFSLLVEFEQAESEARQQAEEDTAIDEFIPLGQPVDFQ
jgi:type III secretion protein O